MRCDVDGLDSLIDDIKSLDNDTENVVDEMLEAAGTVMEDAWKEEVKRRKFVLSGSMRDSVKSKINRKKRYVETYPTGKAKYKSKNASWETLNAKKAYVLHHGKKGQKATYFVNDIQEQGGIKAQIAMRNVLDEHLKKKGM